MRGGVDQSDSRTNLVIIIVLAVGSMVLMYLYRHNPGPINTYLLVGGYYALWPWAKLAEWLASVGIVQWERPIRAMAGIRHANPAELSAGNVITILNYTFRYYALVIGPWVLFLAWRMWRDSPRRRFQREWQDPQGGIQRLMRQNVSLFPVLAPVAWRHIEKEPQFEGRWAVAWNHVSWGLMHGVFAHVRGAPEEERRKQAIDVATAQLIPPQQWRLLPTQLERAVALQVYPPITWQSPNSGDPEKQGGAAPGDYREPSDRVGKALAGVFMAFAVGNEKSRKEARHALDEMALSYQEGETPKEDRLYTDAADALYEKYALEPRFITLRKKHGYWLPVWLTALYTEAQTKGSLPSFEFIWLRPHNRALWYAMNQVGRGGENHAAWAEAMGVYAHYDAEQVAGYPLDTPTVQKALESVTERYTKEGWLGRRT